MIRQYLVAKKVVIFFLLGFALFVLASLAYFLLKARAPKLSADPSIYLRSDELTSIEAIAQQNTHPNTYLDTDRLDAIKIKVEQGAEPWKSAYERMMVSAEQALLAGPYSVTDNGGPNDGHDFKSSQAYCGWTEVDGLEPDCRDGQINPQADRQDYDHAIALARNVSTLGLAYAFTQEDQYAEKAASLIRVWCLDTQTRMTPAFTTQQSKIELSVSLPGLFYGADLIYNAPTWSASEKAAFADWTSQIANDALLWNRQNNFENWRVHFIALAGSYLKDESLLSYAFGRYKELIPTQVDRQGRLIKELDRTQSLSYSLYALNAMTLTAELALQQGVNLYDYKSDRNVGLQTILDYHAKFSSRDTQENWPYEQMTPLKVEPIEASDGMALYEMAYSHWQSPQYLEVIQSWGRPMTERRVHWHISLTHARL